MPSLSIKRELQSKKGRLFACERCGKCCCKFDGTLTATPNDIEKWKKEERYDILSHIELGYDLWFKNGAEGHGRCMWLRKVRGKDIYYCRIHNIKPDVCSEYPKDGKCVKENDIKIPKSTIWF